MEAYSKNLGKTAISCQGEHNENEEYKKGSITYKIINDVVESFISIKEVPNGINLTNKDFWQPISLTVTLDYT